MPDHNIKLSVVIPSYNEMSNIKRGVLDVVYSFLLQQPYDWEIVLTDDGSNDGTVEALRKFAHNKKEVRVIENHHSGKGPTVSSGMLAARGQYRLFTDFDQSTPIQEVNKALMLMNEGYDIVIGSREVDGASREEEPFHRHVMGRGFNLLVQLLALKGIQDSQCGFKLFNQNATVVIFPSLVVYGGSNPRKDAFTGAFDVEALFLARKWGFRTKEVGVEWQHNKTNRVSALKDSVRMLRDIIRIRLAWLLGKYHSPHEA